MSNHEKIESGGEIIAIIIKNSLEIQGVHFFSPPEFSQQLGVISRKGGESIRPHIHKIVQRQVSMTQEVLHVLSGRIEVTLYDQEKKHIKTVELKKGDTILLASGGHGLKFSEDTKILEVKQGPYSGVDGDKEHF